MNEAVLVLVWLVVYHTPRGADRERGIYINIYPPTVYTAVYIYIYNTGIYIYIYTHVFLELLARPEALDYSEGCMSPPMIHNRHQRSTRYDQLDETGTAHHRDL